MARATTKKSKSGPSGSDILEALTQIARDKSLEMNYVLETVEQGLLSAARRKYGDAENFRVDIDRKTGQITMYATVRIVDDIEEPGAEITPDQALEWGYKAELGQEIEVVVPAVNPHHYSVSVTVTVNGRVSNAVELSPQPENVSRLTNNTWTDWQPCWADNTTIYFASFETGNFNIWYIDASGGEATQRTFFATGQTDMPAAAGVMLYYRSDKDGAWDIYESSGIGNEARITNTPEKDFEVVVNSGMGPYPIALSRAEEHMGGTIWNIHGYGTGGFTQISSGNADLHPTFSSNGQQIAYILIILSQ